MINFRKVGSGKKTLVFLHGWGGAWQSWAPIIDKFKIDNLKFKIYALDLPGFGLSTLEKPYDLTDYVTDLTGFFEKEKIKKPVLIGHSFGAQVAAKFAIQNGNLLSGLVIVDGAGVRRNDQKIQLDISIASFGKRLMTATPLAGLYPTLRPWYYKLRGWEASDYYQASNTPHLQATASKLFREDLSDDFHRITTPTLIIWGEKDPAELTPLKFGVEMHERIKGSKMVVFPAAGHFSYLDDQERFVSELTSFAESL